MQHFFHKFLVVNNRLKIYSLCLLDKVSTLIRL